VDKSAVFIRLNTLKIGLLHRLFFTTDIVLPSHYFMQCSWKCGRLFSINEGYSLT